MQNQIKREKKRSDELWECILHCFTRMNQEDKRTKQTNERMDLMWAKQVDHNLAELSSE